MKERPILYSTLMVQAKLAGRKTQTRRIMKVQPDNDCYFEIRYADRSESYGVVIDYNQGDENPYVKCPYGTFGDILWTRETYRVQKFNVITKECSHIYKADYNSPVEWNWKPSIHMPKEAARIWERVTAVRVERLQDITEADAIAEGIEPLLASGMQLAMHGRLYKHYTEYQEGLFGTGLRPIESYRTLWESINGPGSWSANPFVWVITTKILSTTGRPSDI